MTERIRRVRERSVYRNPHVEVFDDEVEFDGLRRGTYIRIRPGGVGAGVVIIAQGTLGIALVRTYRYPIASWQWGLPRGFGHSESPLRTAEAELREELGLSGLSYTQLGSLTPDSGLIESEVAVVLARVAATELDPSDKREVEAARWVTLEDLKLEIARGHILDGFTLAALFLAQAQGAL
jgi:8-oxo-dGTP pyrophosphatase MutT (NUDIX family)